MNFFGRQGGMNALGWVAANGPAGPVAINPITGQVVSLGLLPGGGYATAYGINDAGHVVGGGNAGGTVNSRAIFWSAKETLIK
jgi:uncharacterized membrane protein